MADVTHTATGCTGSGELDQGIAGEAVTAGMPLYQHTDGKYYKALCDTALHAKAVAFALNAAGANQPVGLLLRGTLTLSGGLTVGVIYVVSDNAGGIGVIGDRGTGDFVCVLGVAMTSTTLRCILVSSGVALG